MKAIMLSVRPMWCELIASGKKTIEVRKSRPKLDTPFKVYIYCSKADYYTWDLAVQNVPIPFGEKYAGKVIGEFTCDRVSTYEYTPDCSEEEDPGSMMYYIKTNDREATGLSYDELCKYGGGKDLYGWHISDLKIYNRPKELSEFSSGSSRLECDNTENGFPWKWPGMKRPPQSWCYVEED